MTCYAFVLDANNKQLAPTKEQKAWFLIRKKRATLVSRYPMVIQLKKKIPDQEICKDEIRCGQMTEIFMLVKMSDAKQSDF